MAILVQLQDAEKAYGDQVLLREAALDLTDHDKVALFGRNGVGKSTLCRVLLGEEELDAGTVARHPSLRIGYLHQHDPFEPNETVMGFLQRDSGQPDWRCGAVAGRFELKGRLLEGPVDDLSGGWQTRVKLTALLLHEPNLLILDEPTNFLDLRTQLLLEAFLRDFNGGCLVVSHDRAFLKATCDTTVELANGKLTRFSGDIESFLEHQQQRRAQEERANATIQAKADQLQRFVDRFRAKASLASRARAKKKQIERLNEQMLELEQEEASASIRLPEVETRPGTALRCDDLAIGYPARTVAEDIRLEIDHGACVGVVGDNGEGKTTFLRTITGSLPALNGRAAWGHGCDFGVYAQHVYQELPDNLTVLEYLRAQAVGISNDTVLRGIAGGFLFCGDDVFKKIAVLSGGERARLCLAGLFLGRHNILILDEPANHLDVQTVDALADALSRYEGTVVFTSHERHFMQRVAGEVVEVRGGRVRNFRGDYAAYLQSVQDEITRGERDDAIQRAAPAAGSQARNEKQEARRQFEARKEEARQLFQMRKELQAVERQLDTYTARREELEQALPEAADAEAAQRICDEQQEVNERLEEAETRWLELQELLDAT